MGGKRGYRDNKSSKKAQALLIFPLFMKHKISRAVIIRAKEAHDFRFCQFKKSIKTFHIRLKKAPKRLIKQYGNKTFCGWANIVSNHA